MSFNTISPNDIRPSHVSGFFSVLEHAMNLYGYNNRRSVNSYATNFTTNIDIKEVEKSVESILATIPGYGASQELSYYGAAEGNGYRNILKKWECGDDYGIVEITGWVASEYTINFRFANFNKEIYNKLYNYFRSLEVKKQVQGSVFMAVQTSDGLEFQKIGIGSYPLERHNYETDVLESYDRIKEDLVAKNPRGRLSILNGPPGTGKSYCIKGLLHEVEDVMFVIMPSHYLHVFSDPSGLGTLVEFKDRHKKPIVFIIEDADQCITTRESGNIVSISTVLNFCDGIIGSLLDIRIVATTNAEFSQLDEAIKRPGRLTVFKDIGDLSAEKADDVYFRLTGNHMKKPESMSLAHVYQVANDTSWKGVKVKEKKMGFGA